MDASIGERLRLACESTPLTPGQDREAVGLVLSDLGRAVILEADGTIAKVKVMDAGAVRAGLTVATDSETLRELRDGTLKPLSAFARGKVKLVQGSREKAVWALPVLKAAAKLRKWRPSNDERLFLEAKIINVCAAEEPGKLAYSIELTATIDLDDDQRQVTWTVQKRYSDCRRLFVKIRPHLFHVSAEDDDDSDVNSTVSSSSKPFFKQNGGAPAFPSRSSSSISHRARGLDAWFRYVVRASHDDGHIRTLVYDFLDVDRDLCEAVAAIRAATRAVAAGPLKVDNIRQGRRRADVVKKNRRIAPAEGKKQRRLRLLVRSAGVAFLAVIALRFPFMATFLMSIFVAPVLALLLLIAGSMYFWGGFLTTTLTVGLGCRLIFTRVGILRGIHVYTVASTAILTYVIGKIVATNVLKLEPGSQQREAFFNGIHRWIAPWIADEFAVLTSIWVKLGQYISSRADVVPKTWKESLTQLQDCLPADSPADVAKTLRDAGISDLSVHFPPLASASVAQVHTAYLGRKKIALKVQHRGVADLFRADIQRAVKIARFCAKLDPSFLVTVTILESWQKEIHKELDFNIEVGHLKKARHLLGDHLSSVVIPEPLDEVGSSSKAFAMTFIEDAFKIDDADLLTAFAVDKEALCLRFAHLLCRLALDFGFVHCDCHAGNVLVVPQSSNTLKIAWLDWGWAHTLSPEALDAWRDLVVGLQELDTQACVRALKNLGYENNQDSRAPERSVEFFNFLFRDTAGSQEAKKETEAFFQKRKAQKDADSAVAEKGGRKMTKVPESFFFVVRVFGNLRGLCANLDVKLPLPDIMALHAKAGKARAYLRRISYPLPPASRI